MRFWEKALEVVKHFESRNLPTFSADRQLAIARARFALELLTCEIPPEFVGGVSEELERISVVLKSRGEYILDDVFERTLTALNASRAVSPAGGIEEPPTDQDAMRPRQGQRGGYNILPM
jgi:hypothetical protein